MCGILGKISNNKAIDRNLFDLMLQTMIHRGPDGQGTCISDENDVAFGHRRLALIDLSGKAAQPLFNENKTIWLTANGEIYNYPELKQILLQKGHTFYSDSDSEIIIHGYEEWGINILQKLKGMFAFGLWDSVNRLLFLARDRFGIKPLYYYTDQSRFIFASEVKGIIKDPDVYKSIDISSACDYFTYRYVPSPKTIWKNIFKLPPAHYIIYQPGKKPDVTEYWRLTCKENSITEQDAVEKVNHYIEKSVHEHILSDVPIGCFLSGGYDSSALVYYLSKIKYDTQTFTIGFEKWEQSEHQYARIIADLFQTKHSDKIINEQEYGLLDKIMYHYDDPVADISIIPTYIVSNLAARKVKAVFSGEGADEIFSGYTWHQKYIEKNILKKYFRNLGNKGRAEKKYDTREYCTAMEMGGFDNANLQLLFHKDFKPDIPNQHDWFYKSHFNPGLSKVKRFQYLDIKTFMGELVLTKIDRASMANSLEVRVPFLDHELVEFLFNLPEEVYIKQGFKKFLLYKNIENVLPDVILKRDKQGFVGPDIFYQDAGFYKNMIRNSQVIKDQIINKGYADTLLEKKDFWRLWKVAVFESWYSYWGKMK